MQKTGPNRSVRTAWMIYEIRAYKMNVSETYTEVDNPSKRTPIPERSGFPFPHASAHIFGHCWTVRVILNKPWSAVFRTSLILANKHVVLVVVEFIVEKLQRKMVWRKGNLLWNSGSQRHIYLYQQHTGQKMEAENHPWPSFIGAGSAVQLCPM